MAQSTLMETAFRFNDAQRRELLDALDGRHEIIADLEREAAAFLDYRARLVGIAPSAERRDARERLVAAMEEARQAAADLQRAYGGNASGLDRFDREAADLVERFNAPAVSLRRGPRHDAARLTLEGNVAAILRRHGVKRTGADKGPLALTLGALYCALGIPLTRRLGEHAERAITLDAEI